MTDAETILDFLLKMSSCYKCDCELVSDFIRPHCDDFCCGEEEEDNCNREYEAALSATKKLIYQPYIDLSKISRKDGLWLLQLCDLPHLYLRPKDIISVNQKEFVIHKINYRAEREIIRDVEIIGDFK